MRFETARGVVHAWQCDHMGHANLRAYGEFFEQALWQLFFHLGLTPTALRGEIRMAGVQQNIAYRKELLAGDLIYVRSRLATCELTAVCIDSSTRKPRPLPQDVKDRAAQLLNGTTL